MCDAKERAVLRALTRTNRQIDRLEARALRRSPTLVSTELAQLRADRRRLTAELRRCFAA